jgi:hypothetical protein
MAVKGQTFSLIGLEIRKENFAKVYCFQTAIKLFIDQNLEAIHHNEEQIKPLKEKKTRSINREYRRTQRRKGKEHARMLERASSKSMRERPARFIVLRFCQSQPKAASVGTFHASV